VGCVPSWRVRPSTARSTLPPQVLDVLKGLAKGGVTILATVHSPSSYGFALFDRSAAALLELGVRLHALEPPLKRLDQTEAAPPTWLPSCAA
jgi:hypothetical protein